MGCAERSSSSLCFRPSKSALCDVPRRADLPALQPRTCLTKKRGKSLGGKFDARREIASSLECGLSLVRRHPLRKGDRPSVGRLEIEVALALRDGGLHLVRVPERRKQRLRFCDLRHLWSWRKTFERGSEDGMDSDGAAS
jgi:hypothetical protein